MKIVEKKIGHYAIPRIVGHMFMINWKIGTNNKIAIYRIYDAKKNTFLTAMYEIALNIEERKINSTEPSGD